MHKFITLSLAAVFLIMTFGCFSTHKRGNSSIEEKPGREPDPIEATEVTESIPPPAQFEDASGSWKSLHVEIQPETAELCEGECVDIVANTTGGNPPYTFTWSHDLAAVSGPHRVCPDVDTTYLVTVRDTGVDTIEFPIPSEVVHGSITITVREDCATINSQDAGIDSQVFDSGDESDTESITDSGDTNITDIDEGTTIEQCTTDCRDLEWVEIPGGTFMMSNESESSWHEVSVPSFKMLKMEVTVSQYGKCVDAGVCSVPDLDDEPEEHWHWYNWGKENRGNHPMNGVTRSQAREFADWIGARLPSEAEWEYVVRSGGQDMLYPWGNDRATCEYAVMKDDVNGDGCGLGTTMEVCSKPLGNTAQGVCDMVGNVQEWLEDDAHHNYQGAPTDGSAWIDYPSKGTGLVRGCSWRGNSNDCRSDIRYFMLSTLYVYDVGFRLAMD